MKTIYAVLLILAPTTCIGQAAQAIMEVRVNVIKGASSTTKQITIPYKDKIKNDATVISQTTKNVIQVDSLLFFSYNSYPHKDIVISVDPVHHFVNDEEQHLTFVIDAMGYSHVPQKSTIHYFDTFNCNTVRTNKKGKAFLWVDGRLKFPEEKIGGSFMPVMGGDIQCSSL